MFKRLQSNKRYEKICSRCWELKILPLMFVVRWTRLVFLRRRNKVNFKTYSLLFNSLPITDPLPTSYLTCPIHPLHPFAEIDAKWAISANNKLSSTSTAHTCLFGHKALRKLLVTAGVVSVTSWRVKAPRPPESANSIFMFEIINSTKHVPVLTVPKNASTLIASPSRCTLILHLQKEPWRVFFIQIILCHPVTLAWQGSTLRTGDHCGFDWNVWRDR